MEKCSTAVSFPDNAKLHVPSTVAREILAAAERLPQYDNREFYSTELQAHVLNAVRESCPEAFDAANRCKSKNVSHVGHIAPSYKVCSFDEGNRVFVAINRAFGELVARPYEKPRAQLVHYIQPSTDIVSTRGGHESERLHTDCADWEPPVELISMVCVRADPDGGGRSRVLDVDTIRNEVETHLAPTARRASKPNPSPGNSRLTGAAV